MTGKSIDENQGPSRAYESHVAAEERSIVADIERAVPAAHVRNSFRVVYGGVR